MAARPGNKSNSSLKAAQQLIARQKREITRQQKLAEKQISADIRKFKRLGLLKKSVSETKPTKYTKAKIKRLREAVEIEKQEDLFLRQKGARLQKHHIHDINVREKTRKLKPLKSHTIEVLDTITEASQLPYLERKLKAGAYDTQKKPSEMLAYRIEDEYGSRQIFHNSDQLMQHLLYGNSEKYSSDNESFKDKFAAGDIDKIEIIRVSNHDTSWDTWHAEKAKLKAERKENRKAFKQYMREKAGAQNPEKAKKLDATIKQRKARYFKKHKIEIRNRDKERKRKAREE